MATSVQDSQPPQATGTATSTARKGMITNAYRATSTPRGCGPSVSGLGPVVAFGSVRTEVMAPHWGNAAGTAVDHHLRLRHRNLRIRKLPSLTGIAHDGGLCIPVAL